MGIRERQRKRLAAAEERQRKMNEQAEEGEAPEVLPTRVVQGRIKLQPTAKAKAEVCKEKAGKDEADEGKYSCEWRKFQPIPRLPQKAAANDSKGTKETPEGHTEKAKRKKMRKQGANRERKLRLKKRAEKLQQATTENNGRGGKNQDKGSKKDNGSDGKNQYKGSKNDNHESRQR